MKSKVTPNQQLADEVNKPIIKKLQECKVVPPFIDNVLGGDFLL